MLRYSSRDETQSWTSRKLVLLTCLLACGSTVYGATLDASLDTSLDTRLDTEKTSEASFWLKKMDEALQQTSYSGNFIYMRGTQLESMRVVHQIRDGVKYEKLTSLNGEKREILRKDDELICYHEGGDSLDQNHPVPMGPLTHSFAADLNSNQASYQIALHGKGRVAGRVAVQMSVTPRNNDRYGYMLWLDEQSGLLLQSNLVNQGRVLELFQFSEVQIGDAALVSLIPEPSANDKRLSHSLTEAIPQLAAEVDDRKPRIKTPWLPDGFQRVRSKSPNSLQFSDGVATLTIFVEKVDKHSLGNMQTRLGGTVVITRKMKGSTQQITVVGEIPFATAERIAESVEPVIY